ncbi:MAG: hypothetical protein ACOYO1_02650 [Bacteroidales bacterium]
MEKIIETHKTVAKHLEEAAKLHQEAAKHHETSNYDKANHNTVKACGHMSMANEANKELLKHHAAKK